MIELNGVTKLYGAVIGVNDISLSVEPGTYGLLGPNGSGKTTLINLILGQLRPTIGSVRLFGMNPWSRSRLLGRVGLCPALEVSYPRMSGYEWVKYLVKLHGYSNADSHTLTVKAMDQVRLTPHMDRPMRDYSLGMRQRAKLAQSIAHDPELLILDEPFNGLDPIGRFEMTSLLHEWAGRNKSIILASHILHEVEAINPRFLLMSGGRLLASGSKEEVSNILANTDGLPVSEDELMIQAETVDGANGIRGDNRQLAGQVPERAIPGRVSLRCDQPRKLALLLVEENLADGVEMSGDEDLDIMSPNIGELQLKLPGLLNEHGMTVYELKSGDDSLKTLFTTLMQAHRGETRRGTLT